MPVIAIDLDGTLSAHKALREIANDLRGSLNDVIVLTAAAGELPPYQRPPEVRRRLQAMGINDSVELVCLESREKGDWCALRECHIIIDDSDSVLADVAVKSPSTVRLKVMK